MYHLGSGNDVAASTMSSSLRPTAYCRAPMSQRSPNASTQSTTKKKSIISPTMMKTITVVSQVSFQVGQVTFEVSR